MSFGLDIVTRDVDGNEVWHEVVDGHTYNLAPMWYKALPGLERTSDLNGMTCEELKLPLMSGLVDAKLFREEYEALNPENGWGDYQGFLEIFTRFTQMVYQYPSGIVRWNG